MLVAKGKLAVWITAALGLFLIVPSIAAAANPRPCNGSVDLCSRPFDHVVLPGTHNSMSAKELGWLLPNQLYSMPHQLEMGARALLFDTHYGKVLDSGKVGNVDFADRNDPGVDTYLCHVVCQIGSTELTDGLKGIADYMSAHPREVLLIINEDYVAPDDFARAVSDSGLLPYVYKGPDGPWPTLEQMIKSDQRVVMFAQSNVGDVPWYHLAYSGDMRETPYTFTDAAQLTDPAQLYESCRPNRGGNNGSLFLMNHWIDKDSVPKVSDAELVNTKAALVARAEACRARRGILPTILAVDNFGVGDTVGAARELNGVTAQPYIEITRPKPAKVRAGHKAKFRIKLTNYGDADATRVKVCARVPSRLARNPRCKVFASVTVDRPEKAWLKVRTKKRYRRGSGKVRLKVKAGQGRLATTTRLRVKPLKKPRKHRHRKRWKGRG